MPEQLLDETNVGVVFQQMTSEPVAKGMRCDAFTDPRQTHGSLNRPLCRARRYVAALPITGEQKVAGFRVSGKFAQKRLETDRKRDRPVGTSLALLLDSGQKIAKRGDRR